MDQLKKTLFYVVIFCLLLSTMAFSVELYTVGQTVELAWDDDQTDIAYYEVILIRNDATKTVYGPYTVTSKVITVRKGNGSFSLNRQHLRGR
jgi:hypothetical protein